MSSDLENFVDKISARDESPWNALAYDSKELNESHASHPSSSATTSVRSSSAAAPSFLEPSTVTKPTSYGTGYLIDIKHDESKVDAIYAASVSATHYSGHEAEAEPDDLLHTTLLGTGAWSSSHQAQGQCLRERESARPRLSRTLPRRLKKPPIVLHHYTHCTCALPHDSKPLLVTAYTPVIEGPKVLLHRVPRQYYIIFGMICLMALTASLSDINIFYTDKPKTVSRKRTILIATTLISLETVAMMLLVRRSLLEATVLGLFPLVFGSMFMLHLENFT
ncbi:hypothetical protein SVAN01_10562 [Stagonosporopsis vannaccii]|nr:hypothetical protein SVAN01_10562 [Stagonosporopsis vannaccii]